MQLIQQPNHLDVNVTFTDATSGHADCGDMYATVNVKWMSPEPIPDPQSVNTTTYTDTLPAAGESISYLMQIPDVEACYQVEVTYGHYGAGSESTVRTTHQHCWVHQCTLDSTAIRYLNSVDAADQNSRDLSFEIDGSWGKYCTDASAKVCVQDAD
jgi:hypothetical protein